MAPYKSYHRATRLQHTQVHPKLQTLHEYTHFHGIPACSAGCPSPPKLRTMQLSSGAPTADSTLAPVVLRCISATPLHRLRAAWARPLVGVSESRALLLQAEAESIVEGILDFLRSGMPGSEIAVLYPKHIYGDLVEMKLLKHRVPYRRYGNTEILDRCRLCCSPLALPTASQRLWQLRRSLIFDQTHSRGCAITAVATYNLRRKHASCTTAWRRRCVLAARGNCSSSRSKSMEDKDGRGIENLWSGHVCFCSLSGLLLRMT